MVVGADNRIEREFAAWDSDVSLEETFYLRELYAPTK